MGVFDFIYLYTSDIRFCNLPSSNPIDSMADILAKKIISIAESNIPTLILFSAGSWVQVYKRIANLPRGLDCSRLTIGLVDERWVSNDDENRNEKQIRNTELMHSLELNGAHFVPMIFDIKADTSMNVYKISRIYMNMKSEGKRIFLTIGIGADGHVAGILPVTNESLFIDHYHAPTPVVYCNFHSSQIANPHTQRLTITPDFIRSADEVMVYMSGAGKKQVLERLLRANEKAHVFPAKILSESHAGVELYTDLQV